MTPWAAAQQLGPYTLLAHIGAGGMGEVWKARDTRLDRIVAIKRLKGSHSARFEQEARAIAALNHPNICQIYDVGPDYLVMEFIDGAPLRGGLPVDEALRLAIQIAGALEAAHRKSILHRDLKPANIMVTEGAVKLLDFGLAKLMTGADADATATLEGTVAGTAAYMSPEQAQGKPLDERSDIFSFGAVLYELFSGRRAFAGEHAVTALAAVIHKDPEPLQAPPDIARIVTRCLRKAPSERCQSMAEIKAALEAAAAKPAEPQPSIAVLPFANMSRDADDEYFSDGLAEEIINALAHIPGLKVTARTSAFAFQGQKLDIRRIAETLDVRTILEGSVRRAGNRIRVTAQLINAADGYHLWSERYDRELTDVFAVQDEIAAAIAKALQVKLTPGTAAKRHTPVLLAHEALLRARHVYYKFPTRETLERARDYYEQAVQLDPRYALAHCEFGLYFLALAGLSLRPVREVMPAVRQHVQEALDIDASLQEARAILGIAAGSYDHDWKEAERQFSLALAGDPAPPMARCFYGYYYLLPVGRLEDALRELHLGLAGDPLNSMCRSMLASCFLAAGRNEDGYREVRKVLELDPNHGPSYLHLCLEQLSRGRLPEALAFAEKSYECMRWHPTTTGLFAALLALTGDRGRAGEILQPFADGQANGAPMALLYFHGLCGDLDQAADWAEKAIAERLLNMPVFLRGGYGSFLRSSPRWPKLAKMMNLPG